MRSEERLDLLRLQLKNKALPQACLFYGNDEDAKESACNFLFENLLGRDFKLNSDYHELAGNPIAISETRWLQRQAASRPMGGGRQVFFIKNIENLSRDASPGVLKLLEDSHQENVFVATSANFDKILKTVRSRFVHFRFWKSAAPAKPQDDLLVLGGLKYSERFAKVKEILDSDSFVALLEAGVLNASVTLRRELTVERAFKLEELLKVKTAFRDPTVNKRLLCEYFMMVL